MPPTLDSEILDLLMRYLAVRSDSGTAHENNSDAFFRESLAGEPYFRAHPEHLGASAIPGDGPGRSVNWALVRGRGPGTVVLIHHSDTVGTEDYQELAGCARDPEALAAALRAGGRGLGAEARADLDSGAFMFGHGGADMKAGGSIQLALVRRFSRQELPKGNLLVLALPDEENLSAGMRHAPALLGQLRERFGLEYRLMINSEPHQRTDPRVGVLSEGSVGKLLPFVHARGALAHAGQVFSGLNPVSLLGEIVRRMELNADFCERSGSEVTPPPTCLFLKDSKDRYDVSMPRSAFACFNLLTLGRSPGELLGALEELCREAAGAVLADLERNHARYRALRGEPAAALPWQVPVRRFEQLAGPGPVQAAGPGRTLAQDTWDTVEALLDRQGATGPGIVIGFVPPYYPAVTHAAGTFAPKAAALAGHLVRYAAAALGQRYATEQFYPGICDLSFSSIQGGAELEAALVPNMPLHGPRYRIPFAEIRENAMPCINIGPWGKDFHQLAERVHKDDLLVVTPLLMVEAIRFMLD